MYVANQAPRFARPSGPPNLQGFRLAHNGKLTPIPNSKVTFPADRGPAQAEFSPDGKTLVVTSGFQEEKASKVHSFRVQSDGTLREAPGSPVQPKGASGVVRVEASTVQVEIDLPFLLRPMKGMVESKVNEKLEAVLARA